MRKNAVQAFFKMGGKIFDNEIEKLSENADEELIFLLEKYEKMSNGPEGI